MRDGRFESGSKVLAVCEHPVEYEELLGFGILWSDDGRLDAETVVVPEEQNTLAFTLGTLGWLNPLAHPRACPQRL